MSQADQFEIAWTARQFPLRAAAVAARGDASLRLARRLLQLDDETLKQLEGVAGNRLLVVQGNPDVLPWVDGVQYLGVDPAAPGALLPTNYQPTLPQELLARALRTRAGTTGLIAVLPDPLLVVPMQSARPVFRPALLRWLEQP
jgi:hypothetical protein